MAVLREAFDDISSIIDANDVKRVLILGDQSLNGSPIHYPNYEYQKFSYKSYMKTLYPNIHFDVLDIQGNANLKLNLNDLHFDIESTYDLIIDAGTSEHVDNQYHYILNVNHWLKIGGIYYSNSLDYNKIIEHEQFQWKGHCFYYYDETYFDFLAKCFEWEKLFFHYGYVEDATKPMTFCAMKKMGNQISKKEIKKIYQNITVIFEETEITKLNMSSLENSKKNFESFKYVK